MHMNTNIWKALGVLTTALLFGSAHANIVLGGTRIIYKSGDRDASVEISNQGEYPALVQAWLDDGQTSASPETLSVPFVLTPPISRVDPKQSQTMRLVYTGETLPADRESVFWLNVLEIPPKPSVEAGANTLQFAIRTRIKVFFRPKELIGDPRTAAAQLQWKPMPGAPLTVIAKTPGPFYMSIGDMHLVIEGKPVGKAMLGMVPPFGELAFTAEPDATPISGVPTSVSYKVVDDFGGFVEATMPIAK